MPRTWPEALPNPAQANSKDADIRSVLLHEYADRGNWARHYSVVRMTLGTFFITAATGLITLRWDNPQREIALTAEALFLLGVLLFLYFSALTFHEMNKQREIAESWLEKLGLHPAAGAALSKPGLWARFWTRFKRGLLGRWVTGAVLAVIFLVAFTWFDWRWLHSQPKPGNVTQIIVPMKVKIGQQPEATVYVPVRFTAP